MSVLNPVPVFVRDPEENVPTKRPVDRGMVKVVSELMGHAEAMHHPVRSRVARHGEGDDLIQSQFPEAERQSGTGGLGRVSVPPTLSSQAPPDLDGRREMRIKRRLGEADEPNE